MTIISVFSDTNSTHLIADSLATARQSKVPKAAGVQYLSTGISLNDKDRIRHEFTEDALKIWLIQSNMAIATAGDAKFASDALLLLSEQSSRSFFKSFHELLSFMKDSIIPSITPTSKSCELCGFIIADGEVTKFKISIPPVRKEWFKVSTDPTVFYSSGSGETEFSGVWNRIRNLYSHKDIDPRLTFSIIAEQLYLRQFLGEKTLITEKFIGGAIAGVYSSGNRVLWQPSRTIITFANIGGVGFDADFRWTEQAYKTWQRDGNIFSSSFFAQGDGTFQRITKYSNHLSKPFLIDEKNLPPEMTTFNADSVSVVLLPKGLSPDYPAVLRAQGKITIFDEIVQEGRIAGIRLNKRFFDNFKTKFFVAPDRTIKIGFDRLEPLISALRERISFISRDDDPKTWVNLQTELAVRLMEFGGDRNDIEMLADALDKFLSAWELARNHGLPSCADAVHNIEQFLEDLQKNLNHEQIGYVRGKSAQALGRYMKTSREVTSVST